MTNEEMERIMNFIIERQEVFAERMVQSDERLTRLENITITLAEKHDQLADTQKQLADTQKLISQDIRSLTTQVDRIAETVAFLLDERKNNKNGNGNI